MLSGRFLQEVRITGINGEAGCFFRIDAFTDIVTAAAL